MLFAANEVVLDGQWSVHEIQLIGNASARLAGRRSVVAIDLPGLAPVARRAVYEVTTLHFNGTLGRLDRYLRNPPTIRRSATVQDKRTQRRYRRECANSEYRSGHISPVLHGNPQVSSIRFIAPGCVDWFRKAASWQIEAAFSYEARAQGQGLGSISQALLRGASSESAPLIAHAPELAVPAPIPVLSVDRRKSVTTDSKASDRR
jgi:hypothetical protein